MIELEPQPVCRLSREPLDGATVLAEVESCPLPGVYPPTTEGSLPLRSPLRVVQASGSGFVQLAHRLDGSVYEQYGFAGATGGAYRHHLEWFADELAAVRPSDAPLLEVGCGDGLLLELLEQRGLRDRLGIDPGRAAARSGRRDVVSGFFPADLPPAAQERRFGTIVIRHVLEHVEAPVGFIRALAGHLAADGELWIEVPDLDSTLAAGLWTNLYQLHCNYFTDATLDTVAAEAGLACVGGLIVDVFGGSLLRRYRAGDASAPPPPPPPLDGVRERFSAFAGRLDAMADALPDGAAGYGAGERTAVALGLAPRLEQRLGALYDGNSLLHGRRLAGTALEIRPPEELLQSPPPALVLFALSHRTEILSGWGASLPGATTVAIAGGACPIGRLDELA